MTLIILVRFKNIPLITLMLFSNITLILHLTLMLLKIIFYLILMLFNNNTFNGITLITLHYITFNINAL